MFIAAAVITSNQLKKPLRIKISADEYLEDNFEDTETETICCMHYTMPLADEAMRIAAKNKSFPVRMKGERAKDGYWLHKYTTNGLERQYNKYREDYIVETVKTRRAEEILVYSNSCVCAKCLREYGMNNIENICALIPLASDNTKRVRVDIQRCKTCMKYYIDGNSLKQYESRYGKLSIRKTKAPLYIAAEAENSIYYNQDSILSRNGYFTSKSAEERRRVLSRMMDDGESKAEIKHYLTTFINIRGHRQPRAKAIWEDDLKFVNEYNIENEEKVTFV